MFIARKVIKFTKRVPRCFNYNIDNDSALAWNKLNSLSQLHASCQTSTMTLIRIY